MNLLNIYQYFLIAYISIVFLLMFLEGLKGIDFKLDKHWQFNNLLIAIYSFFALFIKIGLIHSPSFPPMQFGFVFREVALIEPVDMLGNIFIILIPLLFLFRFVRTSRNFAIILSMLLLNSIFSFNQTLLQFSNDANGIANKDWNYSSNTIDFNAAFAVVLFSTVCWTAFFFYMDRIEEVDESDNLE